MQVARKYLVNIGNSIFDMLTFLRVMTITLLLCSSVLKARNVEEYDVKAVFLFHFIDFSTWPTKIDREIERKMCVFGKNPFNGRLKLLAEANMVSRVVTVEYDVELSEIESCQILYIAPSQKSMLPLILKKLKNKPVLTVSDLDSFARNRGMIGFKVGSRRVELELNLQAISESGIKLSSNLIEIATLVNSDSVKENRR